MTIVEPAADAASLNSRSPRRAGAMSTATSAGFVVAPVTRQPQIRRRVEAAVDNLG